MPTPMPTIMISSTVRDLPEHRQRVMDACVRQKLHPLMMEHLPAKDEDAIATSLAMVNQADVYLGIIAYRYGYVPIGHEISITEMEYNQAVARGIPRLIFLMHEEHPVKPADVERGSSADKLDALRQRVSLERVVASFRSPDELHALVIQSLVYELHTITPKRTNNYYSCFISYSSYDDALAQRLYTDLQAKGVRCWGISLSLLL